MTRTFGTTLLLAGLAILGACSAGLPEPTAADTAVARTKWPTTSLEDLHRGRHLYVATCAGCHALKSLDAVPPTQWSKEVAEMRKKRGVKLSDEEAALIVRYLFAAGTRARSAETASR